MSYIRNITLGVVIAASSVLAFGQNTSEPMGPEGKVYIAGPFNYYGFMGSFSEKWELTSEDGLVFTGTFNLPADKLIFCIYDYVDEDNYYIYGSSAREGSRVKFDFMEIDGLYTAEMDAVGEGDWSHDNWMGGELTFQADFSVDPVLVSVVTDINPETGEPSGVGSIPVTGRNDAVIYDLSGRKIKAIPEKGIYVRNGKKEIIN